MVSATVLKAQVQLASDGPRRTAVARQLVLAAAANVRWAIGSELLTSRTSTWWRRPKPPPTLDNSWAWRATSAAPHGDPDLSLPAWLKLEGRSRRPP